MFLTYVFFSYMFMIGFIINDVANIDDYKINHLIIFIFSPIIFPIILGINYSNIFYKK